MRINTIQNSMEIHAGDAELRKLFEHSGSCAQGMIARHLLYVNAEKPIACCHPKTAEPDTKQELIQLCLLGESQKSPITTQDGIDLMNEKVT
jgi:hypothetical protein